MLAESRMAKMFPLEEVLLEDVVASILGPSSTTLSGRDTPTGQQLMQIGSVRANLP